MKRYGIFDLPHCPFARIFSLVLIEILELYDLAIFNSRHAVVHLNVAKARVLCRLLGANVLSFPILEDGFDDNDDEKNGIAKNRYIVLLPDTLTPNSCYEWLAQTSTTSRSKRRSSLLKTTMVDVSHDENNNDFNNTANNTVTANETMKGRTFHFVFYSWLIDSICADMVAPVDHYLVTDGILSEIDQMSA